MNIKRCFWVLFLTTAAFGAPVAACAAVHEGPVSSWSADDDTEDSLGEPGGTGSGSDVESCTIEGLIERVQSSGLPRNRQRPLLATLKAAGFALDRDHAASAGPLLRAFHRSTTATFPVTNTPQTY